MGVFVTVPCGVSIKYAKSMHSSESFNIGTGNKQPSQCMQGRALEFAAVATKFSGPRTRN